MLRVYKGVLMVMKGRLADSSICVLEGETVLASVAFSRFEIVGS